MSRERTATEMAAIWTATPQHRPLPWSLFEASRKSVHAPLLAADLTPEEPLPTTYPDHE